jgi:hypothetical protein
LKADSRILKWMPYMFVAIPTKEIFMAEKVKTTKAPAEDGDEDCNNEEGSRRGAERDDALSRRG